MNPNEAFNAPAPLAMSDPADPLVAYDLSPLRLFLDADPVVQGVMVLLAVASVGCWALIIERGWRLSALRPPANGRAEVPGLRRHWLRIERGLTACCS